MDHPATDLQIAMTLILWAALEALEGGIEAREALLLIVQQARAGLVEPGLNRLAGSSARFRVVIAPILTLHQAAAG